MARPEERGKNRQKTCKSSMVHRFEYRYWLLQYWLLQYWLLQYWLFLLSSRAFCPLIEADKSGLASQLFAEQFALLSRKEKETRTPSLCGSVSDLSRCVHQLVTLRVWQTTLWVMTGCVQCTNQTRLSETVPRSKS